MPHQLTETDSFICKFPVLVPVKAFKAKNADNNDKMLY